MICSFCPRPLDFDHEAVPIPYNHHNVDSDEMMFYVAGDYSARQGSGVGHRLDHACTPRASPTGRSRGRSRLRSRGLPEGRTTTDETAVMIDTFRPLWLGPARLPGRGPRVRLELGPGRPQLTGLPARAAGDRSTASRWSPRSPVAAPRPPPAIAGVDAEPRRSPPRRMDEVHRAGPSPTERAITQAMILRISPPPRLRSLARRLVPSPMIAAAPARADGDRPVALRSLVLTLSTTLPRARCASSLPCLAGAGVAVPVRRHRAGAAAHRPHQVRASTSTSWSAGCAPAATR